MIFGLSLWRGGATAPRLGREIFQQKNTCDQRLFRIIKERRIQMDTPLVRGINETK